MAYDDRNLANDSICRATRLPDGMYARALLMGFPFLGMVLIWLQLVGTVRSFPHGIFLNFCRADLVATLDSQQKKSHSEGNELCFCVVLWGFGKVTEDWAFSICSEEMLFIYPKLDVWGCHIPSIFQAIWGFLTMQRRPLYVGARVILALCFAVHGGIFL